ncbi:MAG: arginine deiminase, partial [Acidobacteria bacterium]|nr:arginine deiminase [Acidobacteriota bacterium]NIQ29110.1 arginine deiminase [Acidobacteriota bacterium]NIQ83658.1 arginine deiminase [Acidobacteriota bacterium]
MVRVTSEVGRLRRALVHEPGVEVDHMVPAMMEELLFDDILYGDLARDEHARLRRVMQLVGIDVVDSSQLLTEALADKAARDWVVDVLLARLSRRR